MPTLDEIESALRDHRPERLESSGRRRAGVAMVLCGEREKPEVLFIERARHPRDPWSGHMAFPGGRVDPGDADARAAAERETLEEVGVSLAEARHLGWLADLGGVHAGRPAGLVISAFVYHLERPAPLVPNYEVEEAFWVPLRVLLDSSRQVELGLHSPSGRSYRGVVVGDPERHVVWGLTYRFLQGFFTLLGRSLP